MLLDIILGVIILINIVLGLKRGLLVMLGRLALLVLVLAVALLLSAPLTAKLTESALLAPFAESITENILAPLSQTATSIGAAVESFGLPQMLEDLMQKYLPNQESSLTQAFPEFSAVLVKFALNALVFLIIFIIMVLLISLLTRALTKAADKIPLVGSANRLGGFFAGLLIGLIQISVLLLVLGFIAPLIDPVAGWLADSWIAGQFFAIDILSLIF
ncbi:MAG: CvpA family protein [Saccharofermentanales bacterium]|jgi:uncharacterized membrane protein required for colicin V production|nr:CvpA family protein [Clostridiaceae bacterium]